MTSTSPASTASTSTIKSVQDFSRPMLDGMQAVWWHPAAAATAVHPGGGTPGSRSSPTWRSRCSPGSIARTWAWAPTAGAASSTSSQSSSRRPRQSSSPADEKRGGARTASSYGTGTCRCCTSAWRRRSSPAAPSSALARATLACSRARRDCRVQGDGAARVAAAMCAAYFGRSAAPRSCSTKCRLHQLLTLPIVDHGACLLYQELTSVATGNITWSVGISSMLL
ncbi:unnamed protein product [Urochloa humidicola]